MSKNKYIKELQREFPDMVFIDPTDKPVPVIHAMQDMSEQQWEYVLNVIRNVKAKSNEKTVNPDFFEKTAEEKAEQNALGIDTDKFQFIFVQDEYQELFNGPCESLSADALENNLIQEIMERGRRFSKTIRPFTFYHADERPRGLMQHQDIGMLAGHEQSMFSNEAILKFLENHEWDLNKGYWIPKKHTQKIGLGKDKKKADYKNKAYRNNAKKAKPSSILLGLIRNNNKHGDDQL